MPVFDTPGSVSLQIRLPSGRVVVTTADEPRTSVELIATGRRGPDAVGDIEIEAHERHGGHLITIEKKDQFRWGPIQISWGSDVEVRVTCPPGSNLDFSAGSTDLRVDGDLGEVSVKTASGDVKLDDVAKRAQVKTASGDIFVGALAAGGAVVTVSGDLRIASFDADLQARSVSGDVHIGAMRAPLTLSTTSGDAYIDSVEAGELRLQTVSGDARIGVGRGTRVWIDAVSVSGDLGSELGLAEHAAEGEGEEAEGGVVPLHVKTVSGDVSIVRAAEAFSA
jgi:Putative adhesin